jgi:hypothetical protein
MYYSGEQTCQNPILLPERQASLDADKESAAQTVLKRAERIHTAIRPLQAQMKSPTHQHLSRAMDTQTARLRAVLDRCRKEAAGDSVQATKLMVAALDSEPDLKEELLRIASLDLIDPVTARERRAASLLDIKSRLKSGEKIKDRFNAEEFRKLARKHGLSPAQIAAIRHAKDE